MALAAIQILLVGIAVPARHSELRMMAYRHAGIKSYLANVAPVDYSRLQRSPRLISDS